MDRTIAIRLCECCGEPIPDDCRKMAPDHSLCESCRVAARRNGDTLSEDVTCLLPARVDETRRCNLERLLHLHYRFAPSSKALESVWKHSLIVAAIVRQLLERYPRLVLDRDLAIDGALMHDIGVYRCVDRVRPKEDEVPYLRHGIIGGYILRHEKFRDAIARMAERHTGVGLTVADFLAKGLRPPEHDYLPENVLEKLVCYADKFHSKSRGFVELNEVIADQRKFGHHKVAQLLKLKEMFGTPDLASIREEYAKETVPLGRPKAAIEKIGKRHAGTYHRRILAVLLDFHRTLANDLYNGSTGRRIAEQMLLAGMDICPDSVNENWQYRQHLLQQGKAHGYAYPKRRREILFEYAELLRLLGYEDDPWAWSRLIYDAFGLLTFNCYPEVVTTLQALSDQGLPLAVISNIGASSRAAIESLVGEWIASRNIITSEEVGVHKPCKSIFRLGAQRVHVRLANCLYVGDQLREDAIGAVSMGGYAIGLWLDRKGTGAKEKLPRGVYRITSLEQVLDFI